MCLHDMPPLNELIQLSQSDTAKRRDESERAAVARWFNSER